MKQCAVIAAICMYDFPKRIQGTRSGSCICARVICSDSLPLAHTSPLTLSSGNLSSLVVYAGSLWQFGL